MSDAWHEMLGTGCLSREAWQEKMVVEHSSATIEEMEHMAVLISTSPVVCRVARGGSVL